MYTYDTQEDSTKYVDFIPKNEPCSIRQVLVDFGTAIIIEIRTSPIKDIVDCEILKKLVELRQNEPQFQYNTHPDEIFTAKILHVESPSEIYVTDVSIF